MILGRGVAQTDEAILAEYAQMVEQCQYGPAFLKERQGIPHRMSSHIGKPMLQWSEEDILTLYQRYQTTARCHCNSFLAFLIFYGYFQPSISLLGTLPLDLAKQWPALLEPTKKRFEEMYQTLHYAPHELGSTFTVLIWVLVISGVSFDELTRSHFDTFKEQYQPWYRQHNKAGTTNTRLTRIERCLVHAGLLPPVPKTLPVPENYFPDLRHPLFQTSAVLYMKWCNAKYKPSTIQTARYALVVFLHWFQEHYPDLGRLDDVSRVVALSYAQHLKQQVDAGQYATRYQQGLYNSVRQFFDFVIDESLETAPARNPFSFRDVPRKPQTIPRYLSDSELRTILTYCEDGASLFERTMVITLLHTGIRALEFTQLQVSDIVQIGGVWKLHIHQGKGLKDRIIPLTSQCLSVLQVWQTTGWEQVNAYLFTNHGYVRPQSGVVSWSIRQLGLKLGIKGLTPHRFRHSFAVALLNYGIRESALQKLMGHATLNMTLEYARILDETVERAFSTAIEQMQDGSNSWVPNFFVQEEYTMFAEGDSVSWIRLPMGYCRRNAKLHCESDVKCLLCDRFAIGKEELPRLQQMYERFVKLGLTIKADVVAAQIRRLEQPSDERRGPQIFIPTTSISKAVKR